MKGTKKRNNKHRRPFLKISHALNFIPINIKLRPSLSRTPATIEHHTYNATIKPPTSPNKNPPAFTRFRPTAAFPVAVLLFPLFVPVAVLVAVSVASPVLVPAPLLVCLPVAVVVPTPPLFAAAELALMTKFIVEFEIPVVLVILLFIAVPEVERMTPVRMEFEVVVAEAEEPPDMEEELKAEAEEAVLDEEILNWLE